MGRHVLIVLQQLFKTWPRGISGSKVCLSSLTMQTDSIDYSSVEHFLRFFTIQDISA
jgi:hypothetical protein